MRGKKSGQIAMGQRIRIPAKSAWKSLKILHFIVHWKNLNE